MRDNRRQVAFEVRDLRLLEFGRTVSKIYAQTPATENPGPVCRRLITVVSYCRWSTETTTASYICSTHRPLCRTRLGSREAAPVAIQDRTSVSW